MSQVTLLLLGSIRLATLRRCCNRVAKDSQLGFLKMVTGSCYAVSSIVLLIVWSETSAFKTKLSIASASLGLLGSFFIVTLSRLEHRTVRPSHLLQFFLLVLLLSDAVHLRTLFLMKYPTLLVVPASIHTFLTGLLLLLESLNKREILRSNNDRRLPPEETAGLFGKRTFWYLNKLFKQGYQKILRPEDLFRMDTDLASKEGTIVFQDTWAKQDKTQRMPLLRTIASVFWLDLLLPVFPRMTQIATTLSQPYLIAAMISFVKERHDLSNTNAGYGLIAAFALNYALLALATGWYAQSMARFLTKLRGCLIASIYEKTLDTSAHDIDLVKATVLMNIDVDKLLTGWKQMNEIWAAFISAGVSFYILYTLLGVAFLAPLFTVIIATFSTTWLGQNMSLRQRVYATATEQRVIAISHVASNMKGIRMLGLSETVFQLLTRLREVEVAAKTYIGKLLVWVTLISNVMFQLTTVSTYVTFVVITLAKGKEMDLDFNRLYGSLSALKLVASPLVTVLQLIPALQISYTSLERLELFLKETLVPRESIVEDIALHPLRSDLPQGSVISLDKANFAINKHHLLFDLTTHFHPGTFTIVVGKVGSGKSILLRSLVGEAELLSGRFAPSLSGSAFCDQQVWLRNATVRENILEDDVFDEACYQKVLWSCGLLQDLQEMKQADRTLIGSKGITLSGGQRNRLSLARALYARKPVSIIDDILAGLDNLTERLVFDRVFGRGGFLREANATVILATHATQYARYADKVIVVSDGRILDEGTYQELVERKIDFKELKSSYTQETSDKDRSDEVAPVSGNSTDPTVLEPQVTEIEQQDGTRQSGDRQSLFYFMKTVGPLHMTLYWIFLAGGISLTQVQYLWLKWWAESENKSRSATIRQLYLFVTITTANILVYLVYFVHFALWFQPRVSLNMHASQLLALMRAKFSSLVCMDIGSITNRFSQDIMLVDLQLQTSWLNVTFEILVLLGSIAIMAIATPPVAACIPVLGIVCYFIQRVYLRTSRQVRLMDLEAKAPLCTHFLETLAGIVTVRAFGWASAYRKRNDTLLDRSQVPFYLLATIQNWLALVLELMVAGFITLIVGIAVALRSKVDPGYLGLSLVSAMDLGFSFRIFIIYWTELETALSAVTRIRNFTATSPEEQPVCLVEIPERWPKTGSVTFNDFSASYTEGGRSVLTNINLHIRSGEKIGLCGRTGSGKSSLVAALFGLLHRQGGQILLDNIPTTDVSMSVLRSKITALPQEPFFLKGTVRHNLAPWAPEENRLRASDEQMKGALEQVKLLEKLRSVAEEGQSALDLNLDNVETLLSQGERQLFCLARAMLTDDKIVVLDEATSSVDLQTDALAQQIVRTAFATRTVIAIAHRLDTILDFDLIVVMDAGRIVEMGHPGALMDVEGGLFRGLVNYQSKTSKEQILGTVRPVDYF